MNSATLPSRGLIENDTLPHIGVELFCFFGWCSEDDEFEGLLFEAQLKLSIQQCWVFSLVLRQFYHGLNEGRCQTTRVGFIYASVAASSS